MYANHEANLYPAGLKAEIVPLGFSNSVCYCFSVRFTRQYPLIAMFFVEPTGLMRSLIFHRDVKNSARALSSWPPCVPLLGMPLVSGNMEVS